MLLKVTIAFVLATALLAGCGGRAEDALRETNPAVETARGDANGVATGCGPADIGTALQRIFVLVNRREFVRVADQWGDEPLPGLSSVFGVARRSGDEVVGVVSARVAAELPRQLPRWVGDGETVALEQVMITGGPAPEETGFDVAWTRGPKAAPKPRVSGVAKGVWDCNEALVRAFNGYESVEPIPLEEFLGPGSRCAPPISMLRSAGMRTRVCTG